MTPPNRARPQEGRRPDFLIFGSPAIGEVEIAEVVTTLRSGWSGTAPRVPPRDWSMSRRLLSLPFFSTMGEGEVANVILAAKKVIRCAHP